MDEQVLKDVMIESIRLSFMISLPLIGAGMVVGLIISIFQAATSIQEQTLTFVPKIIVTLLVLVIFGNWIKESLVEFTMHIFELLPNLALPVP
jgi:flagellar biosynthesis protein FliQ